MKINVNKGESLRLKITESKTSEVTVDESSKYYLSEFSDSDLNRLNLSSEKNEVLDTPKEEYVLLIHGGTGAILKEQMTREKEAEYRGVLNLALEQGKKILLAKGSALDAIESAIQVMEDSELFNAGKGSVFNHEGKNEMDASIMDGLTLNAGAVASVTNIKNPISAARKVMDKSEHVMLVGPGAEQFAESVGCQVESADYFFTQARYDQLQLAIKEDVVVLDHTGASKKGGANMEDGKRKLGTVGAVALDSFGNLAAATSTGGMTNKKHGRLGDTSIIGAGTYANNNTCAVSCTGWGEHFIRNVVAYDISALVEYKQLSLEKAADFVINKKLGKQDVEAGLIAIDAKGNYVMTFNSPGMYRGSVTASSEIKVEIYRKE